MNPQQQQSEPDLLDPSLASLRIQPTSPRVPLTTSATPTTGAQRRIAIAVDLSDESAYAVRWAVQNYLRPGDIVILLHVRPTSVLYGADWGSIQLQIIPNSTNNHENATTITTDHSDEESQQKLENEFDIFTTTKANMLAQPLVDAEISFKIHIVKDHDMKERLCLEVERLGLSAVIMGSRGFGASRRTSKGRLGSFSDYCVHHCICPVVVVRYPDEDESGIGGAERVKKKKIVGEDVELQPVPEEELEYHDAEEEHRDA
ncbi:universal stress protein PHOS34-like [Durio zibethinus]|uniref:Universal stress protein PHOS34-like n=1 Tax=Durio zibethinus TaxID=66656 RepID=A0A6P6AGT3_DURZI|nr:universal stress protein PHOS34-like [Durio zibethinus]XP_022763996.1 universal stress protein PHOS34-like [Durio zibethinus]XP_022763997.1 universal stress protein PHOS34-like [Durio zibethinus]XP_022763998.1 universal stress protein PHOS34-like [Durio zibethinus]